MRLFPITLALVLAAASPAAAAVDAGKLYGGGHLNGTKIPGSALVLAEVANDGASAYLWVETPTRCGSGRLDRKSIAIAADGAFNSTLTQHDRTSDGFRRTSVMAIQGHFDGRVGTGTIQLSLKIVPRRGKTQRCTGTYGFGLREEPTGEERPPLAAPQPDAEYYGLTDQLNPFVLRTDPAGARVSMAAFDYAYKCSKGNGLLNEYTPKMTIRPDRSFRVTEHFKDTYSNGVVRYTVVVHGLFVENGVTGEFKVTSVFRDRRKRVRDRCHTPTVSFFATL